MNAAYQRMMDDLHNHILESFSVPPEMLNSPDIYSSILSGIFEIERQDREWLEKIHLKMMNRFVEDLWYKSHRVKHTSQGQEKRDFYRALGLIEGIPQVNTIPKVTFQ